MTAMIRTGALRGYRELVDTLGGRPARLLRQCHIEPAALNDEDGVIPLQHFARLMQATVQALKCPDFGLRLASMQDIGTLGPLAVAMQNAETVGEAMMFASRYLFFHSSGLILTLSPRSPSRNKWFELRFEVVLPRLPVPGAVFELGLGVTHRVMQIVAGNDYRPEEVHLPHTPGGSLAPYLRFYGASVKTAQSYAAILVRQDIMKATTRHTNSSLRQMAIDYLTVLHPDPGQSVASRVRIATRKTLGTQEVTKERVASMLAMHPRTLQRRLTEEKTSFDQIRNEVRREVAHRYLTSTEMPLTQLAGMLGVSEQAVLTRMCQRWFGTTPSQLRNRPTAY